MTSNYSKPPLVVLVGPTAAGKTELAISLAGCLGGEIVSADSRLFYRGMDIGTAKPSLEQQRLVPHHLIDVADPNEPWSLAIFQRHASRAISEIHQRSHLPFLVGGTGQYVHAVTQGWAPPAAHPNPRLRKALEEMAATRGRDWLHRSLALLDEKAAAAIDPHNVRRLLRALEVILLTGRSFSSQRAAGASPWHLLTVGLTRPRTEIYARVDARIEAMFASGLMDEVRALLAQGYPPDLPTFSAIGYRECILVLKGEMTLDQAKARMRQQTRNFVRRQANWFKSQDADIHWFDASLPRTEKQIEDLIRCFLKTASG